MTLTEQWKKGKLPDGLYWVKYKNGFIDIEEHITHHHGFSYDEKERIEEVLDEVPSYDEWQEYKNANDSMFDTIKMLNKDNYKLEAENTKLKELLKLNNVLDKGLKSILVWLKEETQGEQKELCEQLYKDTLEMMSKIDQVLGEKL